MASKRPSRWDENMPLFLTNFQFYMHHRNFFLLKKLNHTSFFPWLLCLRASRACSLTSSWLHKPACPVVAANSLLNGYTWHCLLEFFLPGPRSRCIPVSLHRPQPEYPLNCLMACQIALAGASTDMSRNIALMFTLFVISTPEITILYCSLVISNTVTWTLSYALFLKENCNNYVVCLVSNQIDPDLCIQ